MFEVLTLLPTLSPMLASSGAVPGGDDWAFEPKLDGWRVIAYVDGGLDIRTRTGRSIAATTPEVAPLVSALQGRSVVLDGELVAGQGRPDDFYRLGPRLSVSRPASVRRWSARVPLTFAIFDVLHLDGEDLTTLPYSHRREALESLRLSGPNWCTVASYRGDGVELLASCGELDLEGIVAKRVSARYRPGARSRDWLKIKTPMWRIEHAHRRRDKGGEALERWVDRLGPHLQERTVVEPVRHNRMPARPWPDRDNPMLGYLIDRAHEVVKEEGLDAAIVWLAVHSWFEGAIEERYRMVSAAIAPDDNGNTKEEG